MPVIVLAGEEELLLSERVEELKSLHIDPAWANFNYSKIESPELKELIEMASSLPFGPANKLMLAYNCDLFTKKRNKNEDSDSPANKLKTKQEKMLEDLEKALATIAPNTYLVLSCPFNFDKTLKISKIFERHAQIENFEKMKYWPGAANTEIYTWCRKRAHKYNIVIEDAACKYLVESNEANLRAIASEIEKATTFILPDNKITLETVSYLSPHFSTVFALLDCWIAGKKPLVISTLQEVLSRQSSAIPIFAIMQTTISKWLKIKVASQKILSELPGGRGIQRQTLPEMELAKKLQSQLNLNPWVLKMDLERIRKTNSEYLAAKKKELTYLESKLKSGQLSDKHALSIFFAS